LCLPLLLALASGCAPAGSYAASDRLERGLVVILDGAGGITATFNSVAKGLDDAGIHQAFEPYEWSTHDVLQDQVDLQRNREMAFGLTNFILAYHQEYPDRPVHLVGLSAGTGLVIFAAEALPPGVKVDGIFLLGSSLSSGYDLSPALKHVRHCITNFSSLADVGILGAGVAVTGTVDRGHSAPAGIAGFKLPKDALPATRQLYQAKLVEVPWNPAYVIYGDLGGHLGATTPAFAQHMIAPVIIADSAK
jgi:pimeloyl-ACP methyl ester carboxylesterase